MLPKESRIPRELWNDVIKSSKKNSKYVNSELFSLRVEPSEDKSVKVAVSVSKKVSKKAVVRNRVRRRTYSTLRKFLTELKPNLYFFSAKPGSENLKGEKLEIELTKLISGFLTKG